MSSFRGCCSLLRCRHHKQGRRSSSSHVSIPILHSQFPCSNSHTAFPVYFPFPFPSPQTVAKVTALEKANEELVERYRKQVAEDLSASETRRYGMETRFVTHNISVLFCLQIKAMAEKSFLWT